MSANQQLTFTALVNISGATGPLQQLQQQFGATGSSATQSSTGFNTFSNSATQSGTAARGTASAVTPLTGALAGAGTAAKGTQGAMGPLGQSFGQVAQGGLTANNSLTPLQGTMQRTGAESIGLGQKVGLMGGFLASTAGSVTGLISGFFSLQAAQVAVDRAQLRVNTSTLAVQKAQDAYSKAVAKFGPDSRPAQEALTNLQNKQNAAAISSERLEVTQDRQREGWMSLGIEIITVGGSFAQMGSTLSILGGKLFASAAASDATAASEIRLGGAGEVGAAGQTGLSLASIRAGASMRLAAVGTALLSASFLELAIPIGIAIGLFALIETNTFGMGDAFRSTVTVIAVGIDAIANGLIGLWNQFVKFANSINSWGAILNNVWVSVHDAFANAFNQIIAGAATFVQQLENTVKEIYNFFITNVINPIIGGWNTLNLGLRLAWNSTVTTIMQAFAPVVLNVLGAIKTMATGFGVLPGVAGEAFRNVVGQLDPMIKSFQNAGITGTKTADDIRKGFQGIDTIKLAQVDVTNFNQSFIPLIGTYANVATAGHAFDSFLKEQNVTVAEDIAKSVNYYSSWDHVQSLLTGKLGPALQAIVKYVWDNVAGGQAWISKLLGVNSALGANSEAADKTAASTTKAAAAQKTYTQTLTESIAKQDESTKGMLAAARNGQEVTKSLSDLAKAYGEAITKNVDLNTALTNATAIENRYNTAVIEGKNKFMELIKSTQDAVVTQKEYTTELDLTVGKFSLFNGAIEKTPANLELVAKAAMGDKTALDELQKTVQGIIDWFFKLGDAVSTKLGDAMEKGHKSFSKALKDMEKETGIKFDPDNKFALSVAAKGAEAKKTLSADIGAMAAIIQGGGGGIASATEKMISNLTSKIQGQSPQVIAQWQKIFTDMRTIASQPITSAAALNALNDLKTRMAALGEPTANIDALMKGLAPSVAGVGTAAAGAKGPVSAFDLQIQQAGTTGAVWQTVLQGVAVQFNTSFKTAVNDAAGYLKILTASIQEFVRTGLIDSLEKGLVQATAAVNVGFSKMAQDVAGYMKSMTSIIQAFVRTGLIDSLQKGVTEATAAVNTGFSKMSADVAGYTKTMTGTIQTFVRTGLVASLEAGVAQAQTRVATAFNAMLSSVRSTTGQMITAINSLKAAILSVPTSHVTVFTGNVSSLSSAVSQAKSLIASVPTSHNTTLTITTIQRVVQQVVPFSSGPTTFSSSPATIIGAAGAVGGSNQVDTIIDLLTRILGKDEIIVMDGKEVGRLVRRHIFENAGGLT